MEGMVRLKLTGVAPLMVHNIQLANPLNQYAKAMKAITAKRKKTEADIAEISRIEWNGALYYDAELGPVVEGVGVDAMLVSAGKLQKRGSDIKRGVLTVDDRIAIEYKGPRDRESLYGDGSTKWVDVRAVRNQAARVMRTRPIFPDWSVTATISFDPEIINKGDLLHIAEAGGRLVGFYEYRPRFGRFAVQEVPMDA